MEKAQRPDFGGTPRPTGSITLDEERLRLVIPQWEAIFRALRRMDELQLGETEPATVFTWRTGQP